MAVLRLVLPALLGLFVGAGLGYGAARFASAPRLSPGLRRPAALAEAAKAYEAGDLAALGRALEDLEAEPPAEAALVAEVDLLRALALGGNAPLAEVAARHPGTPAAARALWLEIQRTDDPALRQARVHAFRREFPRSWIPERPGPP
jgi:hypothetical protein